MIMHLLHACKLLRQCALRLARHLVLYHAHPRLDVHVQASNTHDLHGAQASANEHEKQKLQQQQKVKHWQQQKQAKKRQQQENGGETRVSTLALNHSGARSADDAKARTPTVCAQTIL